MTQPKARKHDPSSHSHPQHQSGHGPPRGSAKRGLHRDWRLWLAVILMLAAMAAYVMTMDESLLPGPEPQGEVTRTE
jgi:hypothetical protein